MELSVRRVTPPSPGVKTKVLVPVATVTPLLTIGGFGHRLSAAVTMILGAGLAGAQATGMLPARAAPPSQPRGNTTQKA